MAHPAKPAGAGAKYRKANMEEAAWFDQDSEEGELIINNLEPETTYEVRAGSIL
jgi:hypothetical protein